VPFLPYYGFLNEVRDRVNESTAGACFSSLPHAHGDQERIFAAAFSILESAIAARVFPAASIAVTHAGKLIALKSFGHFLYQTDTEGAPPFSRSPREARGIDVTPTTLFDLASVTKVVATTTMAMLLYERGLLDLEAPVAAIVPEFTSDKQSDLRRHEITLRMLLAHSSGLPAYEKLYLKARMRDELLTAAFTMPLTADPGSRTEYSDIGFIILGTALERIAGESLDTFCQREIFGPLAMTSTTFNPPAQLRPHIPPTQDDRTFRHRVIQGEVQDENAFVLGGIAAHAGLFATAEDVARFAHSMLPCGAGAPCGADTLVRETPEAQLMPDDSQKAPNNMPAPHPILRPETIALFTRREPVPVGTSRALGWDTPSAPSQSGRCFGAGSFGHLGYTGTSLWIDPARQLSVTLLTNRTWPDGSNQAIKQVRPQFHDAIIQAIGIE
jgi:serine-type D-Ala-D-Ala carboxypeptidase